MTNETVEAGIKTIDMQKMIKIIFISCIAIQILLIVFDYIFNYLDVFDEKSIRRIWNIARENSIPTWFSSTQAQLLGVTVFLIAIVQAPYISRFKTWIWLLIGMFFLWIGIDDFAEIHEKLGGALERMAEKDDEEYGVIIGFLLKNPSYSWHTFIAPFFALCGLGIAIFLWAAFWRLNLICYLILGFGCWIIAQGIDFTEGLDDIDRFYEWVQESLNIEHKYGVSHTFKVVEEVLEMFGTTLLWIGFLYYFANISNGLQIKMNFKSS
jgi:hypothetical protein